MEGGARSASLEQEVRLMNKSVDKLLRCLEAGDKNCVSRKGRLGFYKISQKFTRLLRI